MRRLRDQLVTLLHDTHHEGALYVADILDLSQLIDMKVIIGIHIFHRYLEQKNRIPRK